VRREADIGVAHQKALDVSRSKNPNVLLVNPRFSSHSFWNYQETCDAVGARYVAAPLGLITVAALLPEAWTVRLVDRNTGELHEEDLRWADLVMVGGMLPQQRDAKGVIALAHASGRPVVMGGPDVTSSPDVYAEAEFRVLGEAEEVMGEFIEAWRAGAERGVFTAKSFPDLACSPVPRFDLLPLENYMHVGVQFSRGCPFNCEFCNVIELNGRVPRSKTPAQMLRELDALHALGYRGHVDFVDDNLIGNRKTLKPFLAELGTWLARRGYPFEFSSEASLNLADDAELLAAMQRAGFFAIFVGIETSDVKTLVSTRKLQNARRDITESIRKINRAGIFVNAGFIIGFDAEIGSIARGMVDCIEESAIPVCMVGLLYALPGTQLSRRLLAEGRLFADSDRVSSESVADQCTSGLNYATLRPRQEILADYRAVLQQIYEPKAFFGRVRRSARELDLSQHRLRSPLGRVLNDLRSFARISLKMGILERRVRHSYWRAVIDCLIHNPRAVRTVVSLAALYLHIWPFARYMDERLLSQIEGAGAESLRVRDTRVSQPGWSDRLAAAGDRSYEG
jgi:radical SAM superfamily enzyme YgiQ (UPF0313 family)